MIDSLPLDLFASDTPDPAPAPRCGWCGATPPAGATFCVSCGTKLAAAVPSAPSSQPNAPTPDPHAQPDSVECQWCDAPVTPDAERCPVCGGAVRGDPSLALPGLTIPLSEQEIAARYGPAVDDLPLPRDPRLLLSVLAVLLGDVSLPE